MNVLEIQNKAKENRGRSRVYLLQSVETTEILKVGVTTDNYRIPHFNKIGYANVTDWELIHLVWLDTKEEGEALEKMIEAKLSKMNYKLPEIKWDNLHNGKTDQGAREIYKADSALVLRVIKGASTSLSAWMN